MLDLLLGLAFGALLLRLAAWMERPRAVPVAASRRNRRETRQ